MARLSRSIRIERVHSHDIVESNIEPVIYNLYLEEALDILNSSLILRSADGRTRDHISEIWI
jgi:hypothetical protein